MTTITDTPTRTPTRTPIDWQDVAERLMHPTQWAILELYRHGEPDLTLTPKGIAGLIGEPLANTSYHVRALLSDGILQLVDNTYVRGAIQHHYQLAVRTLGPDEDIVELATLVDRLLRGVGTEGDEGSVWRLVARYSTGDQPTACPECQASPAGSNPSCGECEHWRTAP